MRVERDGNGMLSKVLDHCPEIRRGSMRLSRLVIGSA